MAHLKTQATTKKPQERKNWKFQLIRRLYERGLQEKDIRNLYRFIDWVMLLPKPLEREFWQDFKAFEQEITMTYVTTGERIGYEKGEQNIVLKLLKKRFGEISEDIQQAITELSIDQLESLGEALLDFTAVDDLINWLQQNQEQ